MPSPSEILAGLTLIANRAFAFAVLWHALVAVAVVAALLGWRPSKRLVAVAVAAPLASVSAFSWAYGNPFNGSLFALVAIVVVVFARRAPEKPIADPHGVSLAVGTALALFGWVYPHFLVGHSPLAYLYGAPLGLIPCPTLSMTLGLALITGVPGGRAWSLTLAVTGLFYALFGALRLGVWPDLALLFGAVALFAEGVPRERPRWHGHAHTT